MHFVFNAAFVGLVGMSGGGGFHVANERFCRGFRRIALSAAIFVFVTQIATRFAAPSFRTENKACPPPRRVGLGRRARLRPSAPFSSAGERRGPAPPGPAPPRRPRRRSPRRPLPPADYSSQDPSGRLRPLPSPSRPLLFEKAPAEFRGGSRRAVAPPLGAVQGPAAGGTGRGGAGARLAAAAGAVRKSGLGRGGTGHDAVNTRVNPSHARREGEDPAPAPGRAPAAAAPPPEAKAKAAGALGRSPPPGAGGGGRGRSEPRQPRRPALSSARRRGEGRGSPRREGPGGAGGGATDAGRRLDPALGRRSRSCGGAAAAPVVSPDVRVTRRRRGGGGRGEPPASAPLAAPAGCCA